MIFFVKPLQLRTRSAFTLRPVRCAANLIKMPNSRAKTYPKCGIRQMPRRKVKGRSKERSLQSLARTYRQASCTPQKPHDSRQNPARRTCLEWQADCSTTRGTHTVAQSTPGRFQESTDRIRSRVFLLLQTAGKSIEWNAIRACPQGEGRDTAFQPDC